MDEPLHHRPVFEDLREAIGTEKVVRLLERFVAALRTAFAGEHRSGDDLAREAHTLISMSGMLGCERLSAGCRTFEAQAKGGADLAASLARIRALRDETVAALEDLRREVDGSGPEEPGAPVR